MPNNTTVGLGINGTSAFLGQTIMNDLLGIGIFGGILFIGLLAIIIFKGRGGFPLLLGVMTVGCVLMVQYGFLPELIAPAIWIALGLIWALGLLSMFKG